MMYFLSKTIGRLFEPIGFIWLILLIAFLWALLKKNKRQILFSGSLLFFISIIGSTKLPAYLLSTLERPYIVDDINTIPKCDAVVLLGGGYNYNSKGVFHMELNSSADRMLTAMELVRLGKGEALVTGGGGYWKKGKQQGEGKILKNWIEAWKPFDKPVYDLGVNFNTRDEAINTLELANKHGWEKIALVTSAWHIRRSKAIFEQVGFEVVPVGSDLQGTTALEINWFFYPVPHLSGFNDMARYMHEQIGWLYYKLRSWL